MPLTDWLRIYVIAVAVLVAVAGGFQWRRWLGFKPENQLAWLAIVALNTAVGYGTWETWRAHLPGGVRNYLIALAMTWLLASVLYHPGTHLCARRRGRKS